MRHENSRHQFSNFSLELVSIEEFFLDGIFYSGGSMILTIYDRGSIGIDTNAWDTLAFSTFLKNNRPGAFTITLREGHNGKLRNYTTIRFVDEYILLPFRGVDFDVEFAAFQADLIKLELIEMNKVILNYRKFIFDGRKI